MDLRSGETTDPPLGPLFSVVVPTHNRPELLIYAIASVVAQTFQDWECIVVDDGGTLSFDIGTDPRVRTISLASNRGAGAARNAGVGAARGTWIVFLDDDDEFLEDRLKSIVCYLEGDIVVLSETQLRNRQRGALPLGPQIVVDQIANAFTPHLGTVAVHRDVFIPFHESYRTCEDVDWWLRISQTARVTMIAGVGYRMRQHVGLRHLSGDNERLRDSKRLLEDHAAYFATHNRARAFRQMRIGVYAARLGNKHDAAKSFGASLRSRLTIQAIRRMVALLGQSAKTR